MPTHKRQRDLPVYSRLVATVLIVNAVLICTLIVSDSWDLATSRLSAISDAVMANIAVAVLIRQRYVVNALFHIFTSLPHRVPWSVRRTAAHVYHLGGVHVGAAVSGVAWFVLYGEQVTHLSSSGRPAVSPAVMTVSYLLLCVLSVITICALPPMRARWHDAFEHTHRFGGWTVLVLFWAQPLLRIRAAARGASYLDMLLRTPGVWRVAVVTLSVVWPWTRLRRVPIEIDHSSSHVVLGRLDHGAKTFPGSTNAISVRPLREWHPFANIPAEDGSGFRLAISRAGNWTSQFIDDPPSHVWVKGGPAAGMATVGRLFRRVVWVATGSGIGPVLPHLIAQEHPAHLIWSTRSPRDTYGDMLVDEVVAAEPSSLIWDTDDLGRPDLVKLAAEACRRFDAEAVICIANQKVTRELVSSLESRGIAAYGALWDS